MRYSQLIVQTLETFVQEAGLKPDAGTTEPGDWTIERILEEKKQYDTSLNYEKHIDQTGNGWSVPGKSLGGLDRMDS